jgi:hypothetical protein
MEFGVMSLRPVVGSTLCRHDLRRRFLKVTLVRAGGRPARAVFARAIRREFIRRL